MKQYHGNVLYIVLKLTKANSVFECNERLGGSQIDINVYVHVSSVCTEVR